jgi:adenylate cyclase class 2
MSATVPHEIEVKLRMDGVDPLLAAGIDLEVESPRHFEDNWLLDTAGFDLSDKPAILRVRSANGRGSITYKEKTAPDAPASQFKQRVEIETGVDDPQNAVAVFERLGYRTWFRYQKFRTVYRAILPGGSRLSVMLDETPIGNFIEIEGEEEAIAGAVALLGVSPADYILDSYLALQAEHCRRQGRQFGDMLFTGEQDTE